MFDRIPAQLTQQTRIRLNIPNILMLSPLVSITHDGAGALGGLQQQDVQWLSLIVQHQIQRVCLTSHPITAPSGDPAIRCQRSGHTGHT